MKLFERKVSEVEYRLRLLLCVDALQMVTRDQLWPFVARLALMDYVPMCLMADELTRAGALASGAGALADALYLTDAGREQLSLFGARIPVSVRARITEAAPEYLRALGRRRQLSAAYELPKGEMKRVRCTFQEGDVPTMIIRVETTCESLARAAAERFYEIAPTLIGSFYRLRTDGGTPALNVFTDIDEALDSAEAGKPALCAYGKREHAAVARLECDAASFTVALLMPSAASAARWAAAAERDGAEIAEKLKASLCGGAKL